jgi:hypothetical protein
MIRSLFSIRLLDRVFPGGVVVAQSAFGILLGGRRAFGRLHDRKGKTATSISELRPPFTCNLPCPAAVVITATPAKQKQQHDDQDENLHCIHIIFSPPGTAELSFI